MGIDTFKNKKNFAVMRWDDHLHVPFPFLSFLPIQGYLKVGEHVLCAVCLSQTKKSRAGEEAILWELLSCVSQAMHRHMG